MEKKKAKSSKKASRKTLRKVSKTVTQKKRAKKHRAKKTALAQKKGAKKHRAKKKALAQKKGAKKTVPQNKGTKKALVKKINRSIDFHIENVRCFGDRQTLKIRPLTFLVGENSTGKTTLLGSFNVLSNIVTPFVPWDKVGFNEEPYNMGVFQNIIRKTNNNKKNKEEKDNTFSIGFTLNNLKTKTKTKKSKIECNICFAKRKKEAEPVIDYINIKYGDYTLLFNYNDGVFYLKDKKNKALFEDQLHSMFRESSLSLDTLFRAVEMEVLFMNKRVENSTQKEIKKIMEQVEEEIDSFFPDILHLSPIRSKPQRTYDPIRKGIDPEGKEIPMVLMWIGTNKKAEWKKLHNNLLCFGKASGLFSDIKIKKHDGPFQLQFEIRGAVSNIMDTGYGISQILPLLVHTFRAPEQFQFLIQQPEVHLHPKAQAELSSLLIQSIKSKQHSFIIETHSDYIVDRARIEIRKGLIPPDQVSLIYLEPVNGGVKAHNISFDKQANMLNVPKGFREFFSKETDRLLGFKD